MTLANVFFAELDWLSELLRFRLRDFQGESQDTDTEAAPPAAPEVAADESAFSALLAECELHASERAVLALAICPWLCPFLLDPLLTRNSQTQRGYTEFGGVVGTTHGGFLPTGETAVFLLGGADLGLRQQAASLLAPDSRLVSRGLVRLGPAGRGEPVLSGLLQPGPQVCSLLFPETGPDRTRLDETGLLRPIECPLEWSDLVLPASTLGLLDEIYHWHRLHSVLLQDWGLGGRLRRGSVNLFHGPSGTGKSMAAALLGKRCRCGVLRVDLSAVVSKYIGETEKNLSAAMLQAEQDGAILFFDEADALFGRRTRTESSNDRFANQEVSYLLQRIEEFSGMIILASNLRMNIDDAFLRRFHVIVEFSPPQPAERLKLWTSAFGTKLQCHRDLDLQRVAEKYELTGGAIVNVVRLAALRAAVRGDTTVMAADVLEGIRREYRKEGRPI